MSRIPRHLIDEVRERTEIVEVVQRFVSLQRRGNSYVGLCPFHQEKTPSFHVVPNKHLFHCFGCQASGDVFRFLMQLEGLSFIEAVKELAGPAGVTIEERELTPDERKQLKRRATTYDVLEAAAAFYESVLWTRPEGAAGRAYLERRGLSEQTIRDARLGFAPDAWTALVDHLHRKGFPEALVEEVGLARQRQGGSGRYDFLRARVIFPIRDERGRVLAFGGRILEGDGPKYMNTPESPVYEKSKVLYGIDRARQAIQRKDRILVVEGYMDVIALHQAGFEETVATCGTSLTEDHLEKVRRMTRQVVALFDADEAGSRAAERALKMFFGIGLQPWRLDLPGAKDPDELIRTQGAEAMEQALARKTPLLEWWVRRKREQMGEGAATQAALVEEVLPLLRALPPAVISQMASLLRVGEGALLEQLKRQPAPPVDHAASPQTAGWRPSREMVHVLWLVVHRRDEVADVITRADPGLLDGPPELAGLVARLLSGEPVAAVLADARDPGLARTLSAVVAREDLYAADQAASGLCQILDALARPRREAMLAHLDQALREGGRSDAGALLRARAALVQRKTRIKQALASGDLLGFIALLAEESVTASPGVQ